MDTRAKITSKGQVTIPKSVRDALELHEGDELLFRVERSRAVIAKTPDFLALAGTVPCPPASAERRGTTLFAARAANAQSGGTDRVPRHQRSDPSSDGRPARDGSSEPPLRWREEQLLLADLVLAECVYVLESFYEVERPRVARADALSDRVPIDRDRRPPFCCCGRSRSMSLTASTSPRHTSSRRPKPRESARSCRSTARSTGSRPLPAANPEPCDAQPARSGSLGPSDDVRVVARKEVSA